MENMRAVVTTELNEYNVQIVDCPSLRISVHKKHSHTDCE